MARDEDQTQHVIAHVVVQRRVEIGDRLLLCLELVAQFLVLAVEHLVASKVIDRTMLGRGHEPGRGVTRNPRLRPLLERRDQRVLREVLGLADVPDDASEAGDHFRRLHFPDGFDGALCVSSRHATDHTTIESVTASTRARRERGVQTAKASALGLVLRAEILFLRAETLFHRSQLWRQRRPEVISFKHLPDLDLALAFVRVWATLHPLDRLLE